VDRDGKGCWGQHVGRGPYEVKREHSHEYVTGTFLLAGSEMLKTFEPVHQLLLNFCKIASWPAMIEKTLYLSVRIRLMFKFYKLL